MKLASPDLLSPFANDAFRRLFAARTIALLGSGLTTIALSLLAFDLVGERAGFILGSALALKMIAYVTVAPVVGGFADRLPRRTLLVALDLARAALVLGFMGVSAVSEIFWLIFLLNACSAGFTPIYQAAIPDLLRDGAEYTKGLVLSRVSYDLEGLVSPMVSTLALLLVGYPTFFALNALAFVASALLVGTTSLPTPERSQRPDSIRFNLGFGLRSYLATPRLRGLLALCTAVAMGGAMIIVNTVVIVRGELHGSEVDVALAFAACGAGSLLTAIATPWLLGRVSLRSNMLCGAALLPFALGTGSLAGSMTGLIAAWLLAGAAMALVQTAAGRVIDASCNPTDRSAFFSAHFSLSHAAWLVAYPLAGWTGAIAGMSAAFAVTASGAVLAGVAAVRLWPRSDPEQLWHVHDEFEHSHVHGADEHHVHDHRSDPSDSSDDSEPHSHGHRHRRVRHTHRFVIDAHHPSWPD